MTDPGSLHAVDAATGKRARVLREAYSAPAAAPREFFTVHPGDARRLDLLLAPYSSAAKPLLTATITSPPYGGLKDYGHPDQIGRGQRLDEYLVDMRRVFRSLFTHTKRNGSLWVVADTIREKSADAEVWPLQPLPFQLAEQATNEGWILRDVIIWLKDKTLPWSSRGRMRNAFEYVLFFVKSERFKYHVERLREPSDLEQWWVRYPERYNPQGKAPTNFWPIAIPVQGSWANTNIQHACPLPADLVERMLLISTDSGDVVLDPFAGSGVVVAEAERLARHGVGLELVGDYIQAFHSTVRPEITERRGRDLIRELHDRSEKLRRTVLDLRAVKYPKVVERKSREVDPTLPRPLALYCFRRGDSRRHIDLTVVAVLRDDALPRVEDWLVALTRAARRAPASKFGVKPTFRVIGQSELKTLHRGRRLWAYVGGRTHRAAGLCTSANVLDWTMQPSRHGVPLVVSNVYVDESPRRLRMAEDPAA